MEDTVNSALSTPCLYTAVIRWAAETSRKKNPSNELSFNKDVINTLIDAILYEPTNRKDRVLPDGDVDHGTPEWRYLQGKPAILDP